MLTRVAKETWNACAVEARHVVRTVPAIVTGLGQAFVDICVTRLSRVAALAQASKIVLRVIAPGHVDTRVAGTLIHVILTRHTFPSSSARALEVAQLVGARAVVLARRALTFVYIRFTVLTGETTRARAFKVTIHGHASSAVLARDLIACVALLARDTHPSWVARARELVDVIETGAIVLTRAALAFVDITLAKLSVKARLTATGVALMPVNAGGSVSTSADHTVVHADVAAQSSPPSLANFSPSDQIADVAGSCVIARLAGHGAAVSVKPGTAVDLNLQRQCRSAS